MTLTKIARHDAALLTRRQIVEVARAMFADRGLAFTSLQEIADAAGLSRPGLLKHFSSKGRLVQAVADSFTADTVHAAGGATSLRSAADRWQEEIVDYRPISALLLHEALTSPAAERERLIAHHEHIIDGWAAQEEDVPFLGRVDAAIRASVLTAIWEGLQVMRSYVDDAVTSMIWDTNRLSRPGQVPPATTTVEPLGLESVLADAPGYASGRRRREEIVIDAAALFSINGFHGTTMREIAERVRVTPSALLYHFPDKAALLAEVLRHRDIEMVQRRDGQVLDPVVELRALSAEAQRDELAEKGLISLYAVLSTEAAVGPHPAHDYFQERFTRTVAYFENVLARAATQLDLSMDPRRESLLLVALWDGLQFQRLLSNAESPTDVPGTLDAYISGLLDPR